MKIKVRTLRNETYDIEVDPSETVAQLKEKVEKATAQPAAWQKLIFSGKILVDNTSVESYNLKEGDFLVLFSKQPKAGEKPQEPEKKEPQATPSTPTPAPAASTATTPAAAPAPTTATPSTGAATGNYDSAASTLVSNDAFEAMVTQIMDMGFPREQVIAALNASFRNPDRAVQFLLSGAIPEEEPGVGATGSAPPSPGGAAPLLNPGQNILPGAPAAAGGHFDFLRNHPQFGALRQLIQTNPNMLQPILQQLAASNPQILQVIQEHQEEFLRLLQEPIQGNPMEGMIGGGAQPGQQPPPGMQYIQVTPQEKEAIERLCSLGFDRQRVIEAFLACDKDEQIAANYLLENLGMDDEDDFPPGQ